MKKEKKENLLDGMVNYFLKNRNFSMAALSQDLDVSRKTLYNHFQSKEELIDQMVKYFFQSRISRMESIIDMDLPFQERVQKLLSYLDEVINTTEIFRSRKEIHNSELEELYRKNYGQIKSKMSRFIKTGQDEGWVRTDSSARVISGMFFSLILGCIYNRDEEDAYVCYIPLLIGGLASEKSRFSETETPLPLGSGI